MQYLKELPKKWAIQRTPDNYKIVNDYFNKNYYKDGKLGCTTGYVHSENIHTTKPYKSNCEGSLVTGYTEISTIEFKVLVLGEKMLVSSLKENECIHVSTEEEDRQIRALLYNAGKYWNSGESILIDNISTWYSYKSEGIYQINDKNISKGRYCNHTSHIIYPASYFINTNNTDMNTDKEVIGYVLKPEYSNMQKACESITGYDYNFTKGRNHTDTGYAVVGSPNITDCYSKLQKAGVLNLWFNPCYAPEKPKEEVIQMAEGFTLVIRDKKVFHKEEDITSYVLALRKIFCNYMDTTIGDRNWDLQIDDIIIKKSGCKSKATRYSQWMAIYEKIK